MNVVNLDTLLVSVAPAVVQEAWEVEGDEVLVLTGVVEVQVMVMAVGVIVLVGGDLQDLVA